MSAGQASSRAEPDTEIDLGSDDEVDVASIHINKATVLTEMRAAVTALGETPLGTDDATLLRFLRARAYKVEKASKMFVAWVVWRRTFVPDGRMPASVVANELAAEKAFLQGSDKAKRPIVIVVGCKHETAKRDSEEFKRYLVYCNDKIIDSMPDGVEQFTAIVDLENMAYKNMDSFALRAQFDFLQAYYPERLGQLFMIHVPYLFWPIWSLVSPFIHKQTRQKIQFVENKNLKEVLLQAIDADQLPEKYGGTAKLVPIQDAILPAREGS